MTSVRPSRSACAAIIVSGAPIGVPFEISVAATFPNRSAVSSSEDLARAVDVEPVKGSRPLQGSAPRHHELVALFDACARDTSPADTRDEVILALGLGAGLRRAEIVGLQLAPMFRVAHSSRLRSTSRISKLSTRIQASPAVHAAFRSVPVVSGWLW